MKRKTAFCAGGFVVGILLTSYLSAPYIYIGVLAAILLCALDILLAKKNDAFAVIAAALALLIGFTYMQIYTAGKTEKLAAFYDQTETVFGTIYEVVPKENNTTVTIKTEKIGTENVKTTFEVRLYGECPEMKIGQTVEILSNLKEPSGIYNEGTFYYPNYQRAQGYFLSATADGEDVLITGSEAESIRFLPAKIRSFLRLEAKKWLQGENAGLLIGILLGEKEGISDGTETAFRRSGISHLTAVSGLHVNLILTFMMALFTLIGNKRSALQVVYILGILAVIVITGASPSVVRAGIMIILMELAWILKRDADSITSLFVSAVVILLRNPYGIYDTGFQLSFLATFGILVFAEPTFSFFSIRKIKSKILKQILSAAVITITAQIGTLPIVVDSFHTIPMLAPVTNILVSPMVPVVLWSGIVLMIASNLFAPLASLAAVVCNFALTLLRFIAEKISAVSFATLPCPSLSPLMVLAYVAFALFLWSVLTRKRKYYPELALFLAILLMISAVSVQYLERDTVKVSYINVGQGDSTLIQTGDNISVLIDGGGSAFSDVGEYVLDDFLYSRGVIKVSAAVVTHFDIDHADGIATMIEKGRAGRLIVPEVNDPSGAELLALAEKHHVPVTEIAKGEQIYFNDNLYFDCLSPIPNEPVAENNDTGIVLMLHANGKQFFFGGDIGEEKETTITATFPDIDADVMQANHHGSKYSNSFSFLSCLSPEFVVISYGDNSYGHPSVEAVTRFRDIGAEVLETKKHGTITFHVTGNGKMYYKTSR